MIENERFFSKGFDKGWQLSLIMQGSVLSNEFEFSGDASPEEVDMQRLLLFNFPLHNSGDEPSKNQKLGELGIK